MALYILLTHWRGLYPRMDICAVSDPQARPGSTESIRPLRPPATVMVGNSLALCCKGYYIWTGLFVIADLQVCPAMVCLLPEEVSCGLAEERQHRLRRQ